MSGRHLTFGDLAIGELFEWRDTKEIQSGPPGPEPMVKATDTRYEWSKGYGTAEAHYPVRTVRRRKGTQMSLDDNLPSAQEVLGILKPYEPKPPEPPEPAVPVSALRALLGEWALKSIWEHSMPTVEECRRELAALCDAVE
jgi:hypothetical protein